MGRGSIDWDPVRVALSVLIMMLLCRLAPEVEKHELLSVLGQTLAAEVLPGQSGKDKIGSDRAVWVNTEGSGVYWLHVRIDSRPKYYHFAPYRSGNPTEPNLES